MEDVPTARYLPNAGPIDELFHANDTVCRPKLIDVFVLLVLDGRNKLFVLLYQLIVSFLALGSPLFSCQSGWSGSRLAPSLARLPRGVLTDDIRVTLPVDLLRLLAPESAEERAARDTEAAAEHEEQDASHLLEQ